jgi:hypothetical protein
VDPTARPFCYAARAADEKVTSRSGTILYFGNASPNIGFPLLDCSFVDSS